jgi:hypothetical protein
MARVSTARAVVGRGGLYGAIVRAVEANFAVWSECRAPRHYVTGELLPNPYPYQRLLDAVRAGVPVNVALSVLPADVVRSAPMRPRGRGQLTGAELPPVRPSRAVVAPDDTVSFPDAKVDCRLWMEENGLFNDHGPAFHPRIDVRG